METWTYWSLDAARSGNTSPLSDFDLSYGENCATLAFAYDALESFIDSQHANRIITLGIRWGLLPFLHHTEPGHRRHWWSHTTNWNPVCVGGAGLLALALGKKFSESIEVLRRVETSLAAFTSGIEATAGGWSEGLGYWNYGMRYAFYYALAWEKIYQSNHPFLESHATAKTIEFPFHFCPDGIPAGFGDVNAWMPLPFHYAAAERFRSDRVLALLDEFPSKTGFEPRSADCWAQAAELLLLHPRHRSNEIQTEHSFHLLYPEMDWGICADQWPHPNTYLSMRGGSTSVPHSHLDLLSFNLVIGGKRMVESISILGGDEYLDTTFSSRRWELFETSAASKNTLLINGVGIYPGSAVRTEPIDLPGIRGFRMDATEAMGTSNTATGKAVDFCARVFLLLGPHSVIILDAIELPSSGRIEARFHTSANVTFIDQKSVLLEDEDIRIRASFSSSVHSAIYQAVATPTTPGQKLNVVRWCTQSRAQTKVLFATLFSSTDSLETVAFTETEAGMYLEIADGPGVARLKFDSRLRTIVPEPAT